jgi:protein SCO1/2
MDAMTMPYKLAQPETLSELHAGDVITARIRTWKDEEGYHDAKLTDIVIVAQGKPDYLPPVNYHVPRMGDALPEFALTDQDGKTIHLSEYKGKALLITFIYTRCNMPDYCPRMNANFAAIDKLLAGDAKAYANTRLLSVSFDPKHDTPRVLREYGLQYVNGKGKDAFAHWSFAAPRTADLDKVLEWFDVGVTGDSDSGNMMHSLSTLVVDKQGRLVAWYPSNDWKMEDVASELRNEAVK